jgi:hypothetical protein
MGTVIRWRKSSRSAKVNNEVCVEVGPLLHGVAVRDSKNPDAGHLNLTNAEFTHLVRQIKRGHLDHP